MAGAATAGDGLGAGDALGEGTGSPGLGEGSAAAGFGLGDALIAAAEGVGAEVWL